MKADGKMRNSMAEELFGGKMGDIMMENMLMIRRKGMGRLSMKTEMIECILESLAIADVESGHGVLGKEYAVPGQQCSLNT